jgi:hypothetical protein
MTIAELKKELRVKERVVGRLMWRRKKLAARLASLDRKILSLGGQVSLAGGGTGPGRKARRRRRATGKPLVKYIEAVLAKSKTGMRAKDVTKAVVKAGYPTASKSFYGIVATALRDTSKFKRLGRGVYTLVK